MFRDIRLQVCHISRLITHYSAKVDAEVPPDLTPGFAKGHFVWQRKGTYESFFFFPFRIGHSFFAHQDGQVNPHVSLECQKMRADKRALLTVMFSELSEDQVMSPKLRE